MYEDVNIGVAVAVDEGMIVSVVPKADTLSLAEIQVVQQSLQGKAEKLRFKSKKNRGETCTIYSLCLCGIDASRAIIDLPRATILTAELIAQ